MIMAHVVVSAHENKRNCLFAHENYRCNVKLILQTRNE